MNFKIEPAAPANLPQIVGLIKEFAEFENLSHACEVDENDLRAAIFGDESFVDCLVAFADDVCVGYAIFYPVFKSFRGTPSIYLEDLYVTPNARGRGFGLALLSEVAKHADARGFTRMDWQALKWNAPAIKFYENIGAESDDENLDFRLRGAAFERLAAHD